MKRLVSAGNFVVMMRQWSKSVPSAQGGVVRLDSSAVITHFEMRLNSLKVVWESKRVLMGMSQKRLWCGSETWVCGVRALGRVTLRWERWSVGTRVYWIEWSEANELLGVHLWLSWRHETADHGVTRNDNEFSVEMKRGEEIGDLGNIRGNHEVVKHECVKCSSLWVWRLSEEMKCA